MSKEESPLVGRRTTRSSLNSTPNSKAHQEVPKATYLSRPLTIKDLVFHGEPISLDELISSFPGRRGQILDLVQFLGPLNSPMIPLFVYGGASTGKTSTVLYMFRHLKRPFIYCSCVSCYSPRILFESILNQLLLHRKNENGCYLSAKRCERPSDFVNLLREALTALIESLKGNTGKSSSKKLSSQVNGRMVYLVFDHLELVREWDKSESIIPLLFNLYNLLKIPEVGMIFISRASLDTFQSDTGYLEPFPIYFPEYTEDDLRQIFMINQANPKLYSSLLELVLRPFYRITRRIDELSTAFSPLFKKYCEPLGDSVTAPVGDMTRKLFSHLQPFISISLNETFTLSSQALLKDRNMRNCPLEGSTRYRSIVSEDIVLRVARSLKFPLLLSLFKSLNRYSHDCAFDDSTFDVCQKKRNGSIKLSIEYNRTTWTSRIMKGYSKFHQRGLSYFSGSIQEKSEWALAEIIFNKNRHVKIKQGMINTESDSIAQASSFGQSNMRSKSGALHNTWIINHKQLIGEELDIDFVISTAKSLQKPWYSGN
ncbi:hypothetical protein SASPL_117316 [Salvia splendens]|uniref:Origin recognition complex subunit 5 n=1 Tax=Salvia splendens TaxID=180675 RepID=A0A8X8ZXH5_SALSN|nr:hypothetical protein SASPL_117316 [Salvia splendens]